MVGRSAAGSTFDVGSRGVQVIQPVLPDLARTPQIACTSGMHIGKVHLCYTSEHQV